MLCYVMLCYGFGLRISPDPVFGSFRIRSLAEVCTLWLLLFVLIWSTWQHYYVADGIVLLDSSHDKMQVITEAKRLNCI